MVWSPRHEIAFTHGEVDVVGLILAAASVGQSSAAASFPLLRRCKLSTIRLVDMGRIFGRVESHRRLFCDF